MPRTFRLLSVVLLLSLVCGLGPAQATAPQPPAAAPAPASQVQVTASLKSSPVMFIENAGQFAEGARFQVRGGDRTIWLADDALWVTPLEPPQREPEPQRYGPDRHPRRGLHDDEASAPRRGVHLKLSFVGANPKPRLEPFERLETRVSYFIGADPDEWRPDVPVWGGVRYVDLYPGVDLVVGGEGGRYAQRLVVREGSGEALAQVRLRVEGAEELTLEPGRVRVRTAVGEYALPLLEVAGAVGVMSLEPSVAGEEIATPFASAAPSAPATAQQADNPSDLLYATFLGGGSEDYGEAIAVDGAGQAYVTGETHCTDFPTTPGAFDTSLGDAYYGDTFVAKLNAAGTAVVYATFLGGAYWDCGRGIAVDGAGHAYVTGWTDSTDFPTTPGAFDTSFNAGTKAFVARLNAAGTALVYATFLGGNVSVYEAYAIAVDGAGQAYVTGLTWSSDFATTPGAFDTSHNGGSDAFVAKLNATGTGLVYATFLGGSLDDYGRGIAVDGAGQAYVTGYTQSTDLSTTPDAFDTSHNGGSDAFVAKLNAAGTALVYATFLGGSLDHDYGRGIAVDGAGQAYVTGYTGSGDFPTTPEAFDTSHNGYEDAFVARLNAAGTALVYATFLGGSYDHDYGSGIAVDGPGQAYVTGYTWSSDFPTTPGAFDTSHNGGELDAFVATLNAAGTALVYGTFLGGGAWDLGLAIAVDGARQAYVAGHTYSHDFPTTPGAFDTGFNGFYDPFVAKLAMGGGTEGATSGSLSLSALPIFGANDSLRGSARVHNPEPQPRTYALTVHLRQAGARLDSRTATVTVAGGSSASSSFDFGPRPAGSYQLVAELRSGGNLLATATQNVSLLSSPDKEQAWLAGRQLTQAANWEFDDAQRIVVNAYGDSISALPAEVVGFLGGELVGWITPVGDAALVPYDKITEASHAITTKLGALEEIMMAVDRPRVERWASEQTAEYLGLERQRVHAHEAEYRQFVANHDIIWGPDLWRVIDEHKQVVGSRTEDERLWGMGAPPLVICPTTLRGEEMTFLVYKALGAALGALAFVAAIAVLIWAILGSAGLSLPMIIINLARLGGTVSIPKHAVTVLLVILSMVMDLQVKHFVAPAITRCHSEGLTALETEVLSQAAAQGEVSLEVGVQGHNATLSPIAAGPDGLAVNGLLRTKLYSADGRLLEILSHQAALPQGKAAQDTLTLPPGCYRAVATLAGGGTLGLASDTVTFQVDGPQVQASLHIVEPHLAISQTLQATIVVTNTDHITGTGELALLVEASDGENGDAWLLNLPAGAAEQHDLGFVPPALGSYALRARVIGPGGSVLALREAGYVVGSGPALAVEASCAPDWQPGVQVTAHVTVTNAGNQAGTGTLDVVTIDQQRQHPVFTTTIPINLAAGAEHGQLVTALDDAQPGRYALTVYLDGGARYSLPFVVAAEGTLLLTAAAEERFVEAGQTVTLTTEVVNATYGLTDATVTAVVIDPTFASHPLAVTRVQTGTYQATYTAPLSGTYEVVARAEKPNWRGDGATAAFMAGEPSQLIPEVEGQPVMRQTRLLTVTVRNERDLPVAGASVIVSGTQELLHSQTDASGLATFVTAPPDTGPYRLHIEKDGYADTACSVRVEAILYLPLILRGQ